MPTRVATSPRWCTDRPPTRPLAEPVGSGNTGPMDMPKHAPEDKDHFRSIVPEGDGVEVKPMFGSLGAFVNGNMFAGLFGTDIGVKLGPDDLAELEGIEGSGPFGPAERPMGGYRSLPAAWREQPARETEWLERAQAHVSTLPPKQKKPRT